VDLGARRHPGEDGVTRLVAGVDDEDLDVVGAERVGGALDDGVAGRGVGRRSAGEGAGWMAMMDEDLWVAMVAG
jgi:hypothetical protein